MFMSSISRALQALALSLVVLFAAPAKAITPESGFWYNVNEPGTGISIDITDNFLFMAAYGFDSGGFPTWYTSGGSMTSDRQFTGVLSEFRNGQVFGGFWSGMPTNIGNTGGTVSIAFNPDDETRATITWFGRTYQIQRFDYFRSAYGTTNNAHQAGRMLGEWSMVIDWYNRSSDLRPYPFYGEVLIFDLLDTAANPDIYEGCRPTTSLTGYCTSAALNAHDAAGYYDSTNNEQVIVVRDEQQSGSTPSKFFAYFLSAGLYQADGVMSIYSQGGNAGSGPFYPVRAFRTASRKYVVDGSGPNLLPADPKSLEVASPSLSKMVMDANNGELPKGLTADEVKALYGIDVKRMAQSLKPLEQRMRNKPARAEQAQ